MVEKLETCVWNLISKQSCFGVKGFMLLETPEGPELLEPPLDKCYHCKANINCKHYKTKLED